MNLYTASIVALDAATGKLKWFHQLVHHDGWDFDLPTPPMLVDVRRNGRVIPAVLQTGKMNYVYIFNRETGEPLHGMEETAGAAERRPEVYSWPTQPIPAQAWPDRPRGHDARRHQQDHARGREVLHRVLGQEQDATSRPTGRP